MRVVSDFRKRLLLALTALCFSSVLAVFGANALYASAENGLTAGRTHDVDAISGMSLSLSQDVATRFTVTVPEDATEVKMVFSFRGEEFTEESGGENCTAGAQANEYVFSFHGVTPRHFDAELTATLLYTTGGTAYYDTITKTVRSYCEDLLGMTAEELEVNAGDYQKTMRLVADVLYYGAAAQEYTNDEGERVDGNVAALLAQNGVTESVFNPPASSDVAFAGEKDERNNFTGAGLRFDYNVFMFVRFRAEEGVYLTAQKGESEPVTLQAESTGDGAYVAYYTGVSVTGFDAPVTFRLMKGESPIGRSFTYSVRSFVYNHTDMPLAQRLWQYGASATDYKTVCTDHDFVTVTKKATCTEDGSITRTCSKCGYEKTEILSATGHVYTATEEEIGVQTLTCENCHDTWSPYDYHNLTLADQYGTNADGYYMFNGTKGTENRRYLSYTLNGSGANVPLSAAKAVNKDYLAWFYTGAGVRYEWKNVAEATKVVVLKASSCSWLTTGAGNWQTRAMQFNKIFDVAMNGAAVPVDDGMILQGSKKGDYGVAATWNYLVFELELQAGDNELVFTSKTPLVDGKPLYADGTGENDSQSTAILDTLAVYGLTGGGSGGEEQTYDLNDTNRSLTHNFTSADQISKNNNNPPQNRYDLSLMATATTTSPNVKKATALSENGDYLTCFYGGAAVSKRFTSAVAGKATVTFTVASGYLLNTSAFDTGDMIVNKVMKFTVNGTDVVLSDDVKLLGRTTGSYASMGTWTEVTFEIDVQVGTNTIVLTSLFPEGEGGNLLYKDAGEYGTQSTFQLATVKVVLK